MMLLQQIKKIKQTNMNEFRANAAPCVRKNNSKICQKTNRLSV